MNNLLPRFCGSAAQRMRDRSIYRSLTKTLLSPALLLCLPITVTAITPSVTSMHPHGGQRGKEHKVTLTGTQLFQAEEIIFYKPGLHAKDIKVIGEDGKKVECMVVIDTATPPGPVEFRLRSRHGWSDLRTFQVGLFPDIDEKEPNTQIEEAQEIPLNTSVNGVITREDVDYFKVTAKKGQRLTAEIEGMRLGNFMFDPYVAILNMNRFALSASDDSPLLLQDSVASIVVPEDGSYLVQVRESAYEGDNRAKYRLHVGTFPRPTAVFPAGGTPGTEINVHFLGDPLGDFAQKIKLDSTGINMPVFVQKDGQTVPSPNFMRVKKMAEILENDQPKESRTESQIIKDLPPLAINGIITKDKEDDFFRFSAKKGQNFHVNAFARRLRSPLDPVIHIYNTKTGKYIAGNDDTNNQPDSYVKFTVPEDGEYDIRIKDHLEKGGPSYVYRIEIDKFEAKLSFSIPEFERYKQTRQAISIPAGGRYATLLNCKRENFGGDLRVWMENLPAGVTAHIPQMPKDVTSIPVVLQAAPDAPIGGKLVKIKGELIDEKRVLKGELEQNTVLVYANPNNTEYYKTTVNQLPVGVVEPVPFELELIQPKTPIVHGGTKYLKVVAKRKEGFDEAINVKLLFKPSGIGASSSITIAKGKNSGSYRINSSGGGERTWPLAVIGQATVGGGPAYAGSNFIDLQITAPYISGKIDLAAAEQGKETEVICKLTQNKPFDGEFELKLNGLPAKATTEPQKVNKDTEEVVFMVKTEKDTPKGQHKSLFCSINVMQFGEPIQHSFASGGVLRIDPPPPPKKSAKPEPVAKKEPAKKPEKRLSRLEQLRLRKQQEMAEDNGS